jgi:hypothetical protein
MNNNACYLLHDVRLRLIQYPQGGPGGRHTPDLRPVTDLCGDGSGGRGGGKRWPGWWLHRMSRWGLCRGRGQPTAHGRPSGQAIRAGKHSKIQELRSGKARLRATWPPSCWHFCVRESRMETRGTHGHPNWTRVLDACNGTCMCVDRRARPLSSRQPRQRCPVENDSG